MSGDLRLRTPEPVEINEQICRSLMRKLIPENKDKAKEKELLEQIPWQTLVTSPLNPRCSPTQSEGFTGWAQDPHELQKQVKRIFSRCKTLVIGDCKADVGVFQSSFGSSLTCLLGFGVPPNMET